MPGPWRWHGLYVPIGHYASKAGAAKKPFIGVTFVLFALFPLALVVLGPALGVGGLVVAFVIGYVAPVSEQELTGDPLLELPELRIGKSGIERFHDLDLRGTAVA